MDKQRNAVEGNSEIELDEAYERAKKHALAMLRQGFNMGGGPYPSRDELHERHPESSAKTATDAADQDPE